VTYPSSRHSFPVALQTLDHMHVAFGDGWGVPGGGGVKDEGNGGAADAIGAPPPPMPKWMEPLFQRLSDASSELNVRLFVLKLLLNRPVLFRPWAQQWLRPVLQVPTHLPILLLKFAFTYLP
jgi:hypothetical protein